MKKREMKIDPESVIADLGILNLRKQSQSQKLMTYQELNDLNNCQASFEENQVAESQSQYSIFVLKEVDAQKQYPASFANMFGGF